MSLDEKIGQLFMVAAYSNKGVDHTIQIENLITNYHIGGLIFFQNDPLKQAYLTNYYQSISKTPLMVGIDGEWGLSMRLQKTQKFPYSITMGALNSDSLVYKVGVAIAQQCKRLGIHINFAPDIDINNNPKNPIIGFRSFGDSKEKVAKYGAAYSKGMMSEGVLSCAKHFPGHGDVGVDSHHDLPVVNKSKSEIDTLELYPFKYLIKDGVASIMVAHIHYPALDNRPNRSTSLSKYVIDTLLKKELNFQGLVFTDALNMKGVAKHFTPGYVDLEAFLAGNDILLFSENVPLAISLIKNAILNGQITEDELNKRVAKILYWKQFAGLDHYKPIDLTKLNADLLNQQYDELLQNVANQAVTLVQDAKKLIPLDNNNKTMVIAIGDLSPSTWEKHLKKHQNIHFVRVPKSIPISKQNQLFIELSSYKNIVISLHQPKVWNQQTAGFENSDIVWINQLAKTKKIVLVNFASPYVLSKFNGNITLINAYEDETFYQKASADLIYGKLKNKSQLPVKISIQIPSIDLPTTKGFKANVMGVDTNILKNIAPIAKQLIDKKGAPGCRIIALKDGQVIYNEAFGHLNYDKKKKVNDSTIYDIASITKIAATTLSVMKLYDDGKLNLSQTLAYYLPELKNTNKANLIISDILQHRAGLKAWIPFYKETLPYIDSIYCSKEDSAFCIKVADNFFMLRANKDTLYKRIFSSELESKTYRYSDLSMMLMQLVVERISGKPLDEFVYQNFYQPMGLRNIGYNPWKTHDLKNIAPTQQDRLFRQQEICGYVHDPGAAMLGGVSGHAGVFSTAQDLAILMQMLNDGGMYNGKQYIQSSTIQKFTVYQRNDSRRGLGFDKPDFSGKTSPSSIYGSPLTFGHTGFTGTCTWVDPKYNLVFVFLSNRICPDEENKELINGNYRTKIQDLLYKSIGL
ncbi:MAG: glycoside hydrolase family 3 N-terminal domain-containing protein [Bacteroidota bacterium]|nr:glycoside hydrolase family 3 N-terminal domain-containing protein [Bacteroidota bacterium]